MDAQNVAASHQPLHKRDEQQQSVLGPRSQSPKKTGEIAARTSSPIKAKVANGRKPPSPDRPTDLDSDAETVVLPGKDGYSPSKVRKVRHEDKRESDGSVDKPKSLLGNSRIIERESSRKREEKDRNKDAGSGLSSVPASPQQRQHRPRRRSAASRASFSDSDQGREPDTSLRATHREKIKPSERLAPHKRKTSRDDSDEYEDDDHQSHRPRRQRTTSAGFDGRRSSREPKAAARDHSTSPQPRLHRRSASTQHFNGYSLKKKRLPPPLQPAEYQSDESSANGSPHPRSSKLRGSVADSHPSPVKVGTTHRKHLDAHGQTLLARACARGDYDNAKRRLSERHGDLNFADYAGNTPLQIAALHGHTEIVKLLIEEGCILDCFNNDKDTPLLDAVDNGHLDVVKLLLDAGANPRKANVNGEEPIDRITDDTDNADEIRDALMEAKDRVAFQPRNSEERQVPDSPRDSPVAAVAPSRRGGNVRSTKTRNDLLYMPLNEATLRQAAGRGDIETVSRVLQVKEQCDDPESMVAAARGGHDLVIELLLGIGGASPDPRPVSSQPSEYATPILAAIGQENINVLDLLLKQQGFDPTRLYKGKTYYEVARLRQGVNWLQEEQRLKDAYDAYQGNRSKSPKREKERPKREERDMSPSRERRNKMSSPREKRRTDSVHAEDGTRRNAQKSRSDDRDRDASPPPSSHKPPKPKPAESDVAALSSEGETHKPRRKLISKGELRGEREKQRRSSMVSTTSSLREPSSPQEPRQDDKPDKTKLSERYHDRTKALKRDDSRDRLSVSGDNTSKRHRASLTPDRHHRNEHDDGEGPVKRRRLEGENADKPKKHGSSDGQSRKPSNHDGQSKAPPKVRKEGDSLEAKRGDSETSRSTQGEPPVRVKSEEGDVDMPDVDEAPENSAARSPSEQDKLARKQKQKAAEEAQKRQEDEEAEAKKTQDAEAERKRLDKEKERRRQQEEAEQRRKEEDEENKRRIQELARQKDEAAERTRLEEEKRLREEQDRKAREEAERKEREEQERKRREEEDRLRKEREAEEARKKREDEERKEQERRERAQREEMEQRRAAEQQRQREEEERARLEQLPALFRWLSTHSNAKTPELAKRFLCIQGVRYDTISAEARDTPAGREQWLLNTQVALLLGEKDLSLPRCKYQP